jgi:hypothetical protein
MRKVIFSTLFFWAVSSLFGQNNECSQIQFSSPLSGEWGIYQTNNWYWVADYQSNPDSLCLSSGCYYIYSPGYNGTEIPSTATVNGQTIPIEILYSDSAYWIGSMSWEVINGCMDFNACNFDPNANCSDGTECTYNCFGCTDSTASNYDQSALIDNGGCCYGPWASFQSSNDSVYFTIYNGLGSYISSGSNDGSTINPGFCYQPGCYQIYVQQFSGALFDFSFTLLDGTVISEGIIASSYDVFNVSNNAILGCTNPAACNFNPDATCDDNTCDYYSCYGCTDTLASNYNPTATLDNGSCCYGPSIHINVPIGVSWYLWMNDGTYAYSGTNFFCLNPGCGTFYAYNSVYEGFDYSITDGAGNVIVSGNSNEPNNNPDDISTVHIPFSFGDPISGCTISNACNYNPAASCDDGTCNFDCYGCTDSTAYNFNEGASIDNGTCCFDQYFEITTSSASGQVSWYALDGFGNIIASNDFSTNTFGFCYPSNCITLHAYDLLGMPFSISITKNDSVIYYNENIMDPEFTYSLNQNELLGCGDPGACNYNPQATCFVYSICDYSCLGCTDVNAINFNPSATVDNGSCCTSENWQTLTATSDLYYYAISNDGVSYSQGFYPTDNGFCMNANCYQMYVYSLDGTTPYIEISNAALGTYHTFTANSYYGYNIESIGINEIAGCTDSLACNYNPNATCDYGYCEYYCGGCLDNQALNYNPQAFFDDGSCFYQVQAPVVGMQMIPDENNDQFYVMLSLTQMGNTPPYAVSNSLNSSMMTMMEPGSSMAGPFACGDSVQFHVHSMSDNMNTLMTSPIYKMNCDATLVTSEVMQSVMAFPNPAQDQFTLAGIPALSALNIRDTQGRTVFRQDNVSNNVRIETKNWAAGIYFVELKNNEGIKQIKMQITH